MGKSLLTNEVKNQLLALYKQGLTNREIAKQLNVNNSTISSWLQKLGLYSNYFVGNKSKDKCTKTVSTNETEVICSKCGKLKPISEFQYGRKGTPQEYRFSYCNTCRKKQNYDNLNTDFTRYFKDKYNRWKRQAVKNNITFTITFAEIQNIYNRQEGKCFYSGVTMGWGVHKDLPDRNIISLDKVIPERGYVAGNVVLCSNRFNTVKNDLSLEELSLYIPSFYNKLINCTWLKL